MVARGGERQGRRAIDYGGFVVIKGSDVDERESLTNLAGFFFFFFLRDNFVCGWVKSHKITRRSFIIIQQLLYMKFVDRICIFFHPYIVLQLYFFFFLSITIIL